jgi:hypothetical protein
MSWWWQPAGAWPPGTGGRGVGIGRPGFPAMADRATSPPAGQPAAAWARYLTALREAGPAPVELTAGERLAIHFAHARTLRAAGDYPAAEECLRRGLAEAGSVAQSTGPA